MNAPSSIRSERYRSLGRITLDRPNALNAITPDMAREIMNTLNDWRDDPGILRVVIDSSSPRAFCAGGDIKALRHIIATQGPDVAHAAMCVPYDAMLTIAHYPKPIITLMDGITMGGGVGLGAHARHRVVTERAVLAMPETAIGLTPDAGGSWLLARSPAPYGLRNALLGCRMHGSQAVQMGFADHFVSSARLASLVEHLADIPQGTEGEQLSAMSESLPPFKDEDSPAVLSAFTASASLSSHAGLNELFHRLSHLEDETADRDLVQLQSACPFSLHVTWRIQQILKASPHTLDEAFALETRTVRHLIARADFSEGVRARMVDKDNAPRWQPQTIEDVSSEEIEACLR
ncbi:3-hydroxyisobutyryl-CoA hydrolase [Acetobacter estunensis NRIC 0472]|uniref:3-hydroxyisobutyryl-CoA hydrolase n=1 Tax=Acetobacter estunensis TaxID=104097 RepID=A0A967B5Y8_9PROT|nr:enoyl-CoA hydratase/isomerase family protein [Acetobacter estunensis]NHO53503.1 enoyl-CoA hydratase/isomerase family protein [Acetobacter estunensis]GBQ28877.1 3-hydroxyisobutyryl-CoA hydrolase [Acetobacter estunensis NRIC 0472]